VSGIESYIVSGVAISWIIWIVLFGLRLVISGYGKNSFWIENMSMRFVFFVLFCVVSVSSNASEPGTSLTESVCPISITTLGPCAHNEIKASIFAKNLGTDKKVLQTLNVEYNGKTFPLAISKDTTIRDGDNGFVLFDDINFDGITDIAITTSFGKTNLYLDYWVYNKSDNKFEYVGNYVKFSVDQKNKTLSTIVKDVAAKFDNVSYTWKGLKLVRLN